MNINFFTAYFPYTKLEQQVDGEFEYIAKCFDRILIFPHLFKGEGEFCRDLTDNVEIANIRPYKSERISFSYWVLIFRFYLLEFLATNKKLFFLRRSIVWGAHLKEAARKARYIEKHKLLLPNSVNYSYWMNDWALVLAFLKKRKSVSSFIFRCGGFDIWDSRHPGNYLPFRGLIYRYADCVMPNSRISELYLKTKTKLVHKISHQYLGTRDCGAGYDVKNELLTIVSCSSVIPLKRIQLIVEALVKVENKVKWIHFGAGSDFENLKLLVEQKLGRHEVDLRGNVSNAELMKFYANNWVDLFITTSSTEGLPVSVQEAISFGIPIIATNVGAMAEVVTNTTGILLEKDFSITELANILENWKESNFNSGERRSEIRMFWKSKFDAQIIYPEFVSKIQKFN